MDNQKLLPCPFCGSDAKCEDGFLPFESVFYTYCGNPDCVLHLIDDFKFTAEEWNTRHPNKSDLGRWISVEDEIPITEGQVLCRYIKSFLGVPSPAYETMYFDADSGGWLYWHSDRPVGYAVTHWMPLPEPPK